MSGKFQQFQSQFAAMPVPVIPAVPKPAVQEGLSNMERQQLATLCSHPAFAVLERLLEFEAERFTNQLLDVNPANAQEVLSAHTRAQVAWEIVSHLLRQIKYEVGEAAADADATDELIDPTSDPLDLLS